MSNQIETTPDRQIIRKIDYIQSQLEQLDKYNEEYDKLILEKTQQITVLEQEVIELRRKADENSTQRKVLEEQLRNYYSVLDSQIEERINFHEKALRDLKRQKERRDAQKRFAPY